MMRSEAPAPRDALHHATVDPHRRNSALADVILGAQDGLVNVLGVILGVAAATESVRIVVVAGLAAALAESFSMAAVAYTSRVAAGDLYESEKARERRHVRVVPTIEREEIRAIFAAKGFEGELLDRIVATITANEEVWVAEMMAEEHGLVPVDRRASLRAAVVVGVAALVGSVIPLLPFAVARVPLASGLALGLAAAVLFAGGAYKARVTVGSWWKSGLEMSVIGTASALVGYAIGTLLRVPTTP
jgi:predicted membrane protein (TIGR00267 family)